MTEPQDWHRCRRCGETSFCPEEDMIRYGTRHWMHKRCYIVAGKPLDALSDRQLAELPYFALKDAGLLDYVRQRLGV
jgi:hypothetical protein